MSTTIEAGADIIDVRDIIARVEELRSEREDLESAITDAEEEVESLRPTPADPDDAEEFAEAEKTVDDARKALAAWTTGDEGKELATLTELLSDLCGYGGDEQWEGDWYPTTLIHENYLKKAWTRW